MRMTLPLTLLAMLAFAANSLLARSALAGHLIDASRFTAIRLCAGAIALAALIAVGRGPRALGAPNGTWLSALALLAYGLAFSLAYVRLDAATGALILFAAVQATMIVTGLLRGDRPGAREWLGLAVALASFVYLLLPGLSAPDLAGSLLMTVAGMAWGAYSLRGRAASDPIGETAGNFMRAAFMALPLFAAPLVSLVFLSVQSSPFANFPTLQFQSDGFVLAAVSGAITSGLGYVVWYRALPALSRLQAATVQLSVPVIAALGAVLLLGETMTTRLAVAGCGLLGGIALAIHARRH